MKILVTNHSLCEIGGTQTWCETMIQKLVSRGQDVEAFTFMTGKFGDRLACIVKESVGALEPGYDLILVNHNTCLGVIQKIAGTKVFTSHGPYHNLEKPILGADHYIAVSEEVQGISMTRDGMASNVIRQPIDISRFRPRTTRPKVKDVLVMCKNETAARIASAACRKAGLSCDLAHYTVAPRWDMEEVIPDYRAVITSGRGAYEAIACEVAVIVFDLRAQKIRADGWVTRTNVENLQRYNLSGRATDMPWAVDDLSEALKEIDAHEAMEWGWEWSVKYHDSERICDQYLAYSLKNRQTEAA